MAMTAVPMLALPNIKKPFIIKIDALGYGVGAVLSHNQRPIAFSATSCLLKLDLSQFMNMN